MGTANTQWIIKSPFYVNFKKHFCPDCNILLHTVKVSRIVHPGSPDAERFDLHITGGPHFIGKVKVVWTEFECSQCSRRITVEEMKQIESHNA